MYQKVLCDDCGEDYSFSYARGGAIFTNHAICPNCVPKMWRQVAKYDEEHLVRGVCPEPMTFRDWIVMLREHQTERTIVDEYSSNVRHDVQNNVLSIYRNMSIRFQMPLNAEPWRTGASAFQYAVSDLRPAIDAWAAIARLRKAHPHPAFTDSFELLDASICNALAHFVALFAGSVDLRSPWTVMSLSGSALLRTADSFGGRRTIRLEAALVGPSLPFQVPSLIEGEPANLSPIFVPVGA